MKGNYVSLLRRHDDLLETGPLDFESGEVELASKNASNASHYRDWK